MNLTSFINEIAKQNFINTATNHYDISIAVQESIHKLLVRQDILIKLEKDIKDDPLLKEDIIELLYRINSRTVLIEKNGNV